MVAEKTKARGTKLVPGRREFERDFKFPLSLGQPDCRRLDNLGRRLLDAIDGGTDMQISVVDASLDFENHKVAKITLASSTEEIDYWIDLERGAIPLKIVERVAPQANASGYQAIYYLDDIRLIPGRGWLPYRESWWYSYNRQGGQILVREADFDKPPEDSAFALEFAEATSLVDSAKGLRYPARRSWNILHLPRGNAPGVEKVEYASIAADRVPLQPGELPAPPRYHPLIYGAIGLTLAVILLIWRWRSRHD